jgi:hypothetical protein
MTEIEIPLSKTKIILLLIGALAFVFAGAWGILDPEKFAWIRSSKKFVLISGIAAVLSFALCSIYITIKMFSRKPRLVICNAEIINNSNTKRVGLIKWNEKFGNSIF